MTRGGPANTGANSASLQVAGQSLIEYQARSLAASGAQHIVVMVDTLPASLVAAFDRLRGEGFSIDTARTPQEAADRLHPDETIMVLTPGLVTSASVLQSLAALPAPVVATLAEGAPAGRFERIDASDRWGGIASITGSQLRQISATLGDWDFAATTLRVALQHGGSRMPVPQAAVLGIIDTHAEAADASSQLSVMALAIDRSPFGRWIAAPLAGLGLSQSIRMALPFEIVSVVPVALLLTAVLLGWIGWPAVAFMCFAVAGITHDIAVGLSGCALRQSAAVGRYPIAALGVFAILCFLAALSWADAGWGVYALASWLAIDATLNRTSHSRWHPSLCDLAVLLAISAASGAPVIGLILAIGWQLTTAMVTSVMPKR